MSKVYSVIKAIIPNRVQRVAKRYTIKVKHRLEPLISLIYVSFAPIFYFLFIKSSDKYLICRPNGGFNDVLSRSETAVRYSYKHRRKLFIYTANVDYCDDLSNYFILPSYISSGKIEDIQYPASVYPQYLSGNIYEFEDFREEKKMLDSKGESYNTSDINSDYKEQYLICNWLGDRQTSICFFKRIKLVEHLRIHISRKVRQLGKYSAVHIRNTENYQTDYKMFLKIVKEDLDPLHTIAVCTDSYEVQEYSKALFGERLVLPSIIPDYGGKSIHVYKHPDIQQKRRENVDAITDLFILACSKKLYTSVITTEQKKKTIEDKFYSGYSLLAMNLHKRKRLVTKLLSG